MRTIPFAVAALLLAAPVQAQSLRASIQTFCDAVRKINQQGLSAAPGSMAAAIIASEAGQDQATYRKVWGVSKGSDVSACRSIW
jgi:hypothetical protein